MSIPSALSDQAFLKSTARSDKNSQRNHRRKNVVLVNLPPPDLPVTEDTQEPLACCFFFVHLSRALDSQSADQKIKRFDQELTELLSAGSEYGIRTALSHTAEAVTEHQVHRTGSKKKSVTDLLQNVFQSV